MNCKFKIVSVFRHVDVQQVEKTDIFNIGFEFKSTFCREIYRADKRLVSIVILKFNYVNIVAEFKINTCFRREIISDFKIEQCAAFISFIDNDIFRRTEKICGYTGDGCFFCFFAAYVDVDAKYDVRKNRAQILEIDFESCRFDYVVDSAAEVVQKV